MTHAGKHSPSAADAVGPGTPREGQSLPCCPGLRGSRWAEEAGSHLGSRAGTVPGMSKAHLPAQVWCVAGPSCVPEGGGQGGVTRHPPRLGKDSHSEDRRPRPIPQPLTVQNQSLLKRHQAAFPSLLPLCRESLFRGEYLVPQTFPPLDAGVIITEDDVGWGGTSDPRAIDLGQPWGRGWGRGQPCSHPLTESGLTSSSGGGAGGGRGPGLSSRSSRRRGRQGSCCALGPALSKRGLGAFWVRPPMWPCD